MVGNRARCAACGQPLRTSTGKGRIVRVVIALALLLGVGAWVWSVLPELLDQAGSALDLVVAMFLRFWPALLVFALVTLIIFDKDTWR